MAPKLRAALRRWRVLRSDPHAPEFVTGVRATGGGGGGSGGGGTAAARRAFCRTLSSDGGPGGRSQPPSTRASTASLRCALASFPDDLADDPHLTKVWNRIAQRPFQAYARGDSEGKEEEGKQGHGGARINSMGRSSGGLYVGIPVFGGGEAGPHRSEHGLQDYRKQQHEQLE